VIRVLVVDDSRLARTVLREILEVDPELTVVAEAENGAEAVDRCLEVGPDVILMDIQMPVMDGLAAVERIMAERPTPVIILSATVHPGEVKSAFRAVRAGAFEALPKPAGITTRSGYGRIAGDLRSRVKLYARVGHRKGWLEAQDEPRGPPALVYPAFSRRVVAIGASTGGPRTAQAILKALPRGFPCPILLVQHIGEGFTRGFAQWLDREIQVEVNIVDAPTRLRPGVLHLARDGNHLEVRRGKAVLRDTPPVNGCRPSVDVLFQSVAREYGPEGVGVVLTGMGKDGARGALAMRRAGGQVVVQNEESSVIFGMPRAAIEAGAATHVAAARDIPRILAELLAAESTPGEEEEVW
jgi:two-component system chemotaxis response regulator CheB